MLTSKLNFMTWSEDICWNEQGEEWSVAWGDSESQWFGSILPRIHRFIPCNNILDIACGYGRWTRFLLPLTNNRYVGIDFDENCIDYCNKRFISEKASFFQNDGFSLELAKGEKFDFIFSFDSLVLADTTILNAYIEQIMELLSDNGVCFIHHSNFGQIVHPGSDIVDHPGFIHGRDQSSTAEKVKNIIEDYGGEVIQQELVNWGCDNLIDCFTLFSHKNTINRKKTGIIYNYNFMNEAQNCKDIFQLYKV